jgi:gamma-tubulin complex component 5
MHHFCRGSSDSDIVQTPWPLNYVFDPSTMTVYSRVFNFLVQIRYAKQLVDCTPLLKVVPSEAGLPGPSPGELHAFYCLRQRLSWVVDLWWTHFMTFVSVGSAWSS